MPALLEALQSGKCFEHDNQIWRNRGTLHCWDKEPKRWIIKELKYVMNVAVEYVADPSAYPCTFMQAWEHMQKYPGQEVCIWKNLRCRNVRGDILDHLDDDLFANHFACTIIDSNDWQLIPQSACDTNDYYQALAEERAKGE